MSQLSTGSSDGEQSAEFGQRDGELGGESARQRRRREKKWKTMTIACRFATSGIAFAVAKPPKISARLRRFSQNGPVLSPSGPDFRRSAGPTHPQGGFKLGGEGERGVPEKSSSVSGFCRKSYPMVPATRGTNLTGF